MATHPAALHRHAARRPDQRSLPDALERSLCALTHPLTVGCVLLLLLNDHVLKQAHPSALTGKLSDFAGLFFFPYLLAAAFGLLRRGLASIHFRRRPLPTAPGTGRLLWWIPYLVTAGLFALLKLDPAANAASNRLFQSAFGLPIRFAHDPSDLIALSALIPSWRLWSSSSRGRPASGRRSLAVLGLASLAAMATAPCPPEQPITHLVSHEGRLYALATAWDPVSNAFLSGSEGRSWEYRDPEQLPAAVLEAALARVSLPKTACAPGMEQVCYRATGEERVEVSSDAGQTWQVAWSPPASRRAYMQRVASGYGQLLACGKTLDLRARDVAVLGAGPGHVAIVALGNEGVLVGRDGQDPWSRVGVGWAEPTPEHGDPAQLFPPLIILGETGRALAAGVAVFLFLSALSWPRLESGAAPHSEAQRPRRPWVVALIVDLVLLGLLALGDMEELIPTVLPALLGLTAVITALYLRWARAYRRTPRPPDARRALRIAVFTSMLVAVVHWIPFALWVPGWIPGYSAAFWLSIVATTAGLVWGMGRLPKVSRPVDEPVQPSS